MKKFILILGAIFLSQSAFADESLLSSCYKNYHLGADKIYMLTLSALNSTGQFEVTEMQSKSGYILFLNSNKQYIATISKEGANTSSIKILPANSDFTGGTFVQKTIFDTIDLNLKNIPEKLL